MEPDRELSSWWVGTTQFPLRQTVPPPQMTWVMGRLTKTQKSNRPPNIYPEQWTTMSPKNQAKAIADWKIEGPKRDTARARRGLPIYIPDEEKDIYNKITTEARARLDQSGGPAPAMSVVEACPQVCQPGGSANGATPPHIDNITSKGQQTNDF